MEVYVAGRKKVKIEHPPGSVDFSVEDVCRSELEAAVDIYVRSQNVIATHLLASAAHEVMRGHAKRHGLKLHADVHDYFRKALGPDAETAIRSMSTPYNAMKHSNPGDAAVTIHPGFAEMTLLQACQEFGAMFGIITPKMTTFCAWCMVAHEGLRATLPVNFLKTFKSATQDVPKSIQLQEARRFIDDIDINPANYIARLEEFSTLGIFKA